MIEHALTELKEHITGNIVLPKSSQYNLLRNSFVHQGSPAIIIQPRTTQEVAAAIRFARQQKLILSVRSGGHGFSGLSTNDKGVVIDLSLIHDVTIIDPKKHLVRIEAGARWGDVAKQLDTNGLAISSGDTNSVGVGGLTLGGGIGWQVRKFGLTIDQLEAAELVLADGTEVRASKDENADLFWAIRGGGGNFGIATSFEFQAHPLKHILGGTITYPLAQMKQVLEGWAAYMRTAPQELNSTFMAIPGFGPKPVPMVMIIVCCDAEDEVAAHAAIQPLLELGTPSDQTIQKKSYYQMLEDAPTPPGLLLPESGFIKKIDDKVVATVLAHYGRVGTPILQLRSLGGAMAKVAPNETAFAYRDYEALVWSVILVPTDTPVSEGKRLLQASWRQGLGPLTEGAYVNFLGELDTDSLARVYPTSTYERLAKLKAIYDPDNIFNRNGNITPQR